MKVDVRASPRSVLFVSVSELLIDYTLMSFSTQRYLESHPNPTGWVASVVFIGPQIIDNSSQTMPSPLEHLFHETIWTACSTCENVYNKCLQQACILSLVS